MVYDAIINGARGIAFFGGDNPHCWTPTDRRYRWNWSFWNTALAPLIKQINSHSPLGTALNNAASNQVLKTSNAGTEAISRHAATPGRTTLWIIAARNKPGVKHVTIVGLPHSATSATVYGEQRTVPLRHGTLTDTFRSWQVHIYRIQRNPRAH